MIKKIEYIILSFFLTRVLFIGTGFKIIINLSKNTFLLSSLLGMLIGLIILFILYKKNNINKYICILISIILLITLSLKNILLTKEYLLTQTPIIIIISVFILLNYQITKNNIITTSKISTIIIIPTILITVFSFCNLTTNINLNNLLPIFNSDSIYFIKSTFIFTALSVLPNILLINYKNELNYKVISLGYILGSVFTIIILFYIISIYGYNLTSLYKYPDYLLLKKIFIDNTNSLQNILILEWISCIFITSFICSNSIKNYLNNTLLIVILAIIILTTIFLYNNIIILNIITNNIIYIFIVLIITTIITKKNKE